MKRQPKKCPLPNKFRLVFRFLMTFALAPASRYAKYAPTSKLRLSPAASLQGRRTQYYSVLLGQYLDPAQQTYQNLENPIVPASHELTNRFVSALLLSAARIAQDQLRRPIPSRALPLQASASRSASALRAPLLPSTLRGAPPLRLLPVARPRPR